jgi:pantetheine-phosphate adenylyltransferase
VPRRPARTSRQKTPVRPTTARVRGALYDRLAGAVVGAEVLDLFAGTGALGIEALHRGARAVTFVEVSASRVRSIRDAVQRADVEAQVEVRHEDARDAIQRLARARRAFDLILLDPPYGEGWITEALNGIAAGDLLRQSGWVVAEGHWRDRPEPVGEWIVAREARYGETALWFLRRGGAERHAGTAEHDEDAVERGGGPVRTAVYPGSFDPVHHGHIEVIRRAMQLFDHVIVAVAENVDKTPGAFSLDERVAMLEDVVREMPTVEVASFGGLTVVFAEQRGATCLIKGLRAVGDFDYELKQSAMNRRLAPALDTLLFIADPEFAFVSSSLIREVARLGGSVDGLVPAAVATRLSTRWPRQS